MYTRKIYLNKFKLKYNVYPSPDPHAGSVTVYYLFIFTIYFLFYTVTEKTDLFVLMLHDLCNMFLEHHEAKKPFTLTIL